ncbi:unnamed protein product [Clonostachys rosea f. rosea IK726]|uniref:Uncharacterized protein n=2 Tax=Bionectria ochroleuca TaxID=29856 RepID=A0A0B7K8G7_BIOOC|nr:unnamed protein product [Clonostachys rosea f. rosea IK726]
MDSKTGACPAFRDNKDLYGLGIRLGFYIQWVGLIICELFDKKKQCNQPRHFHSEFFAIRITNASFVTAEFIAILVQIAKTSLKSDRNTEFIQPVDIYIVLLLCFGSSIFLVVVFIWNMFTPLNVDYPMRPSRLSVRLSCLLLTAVSLFQLWFWSQNFDFENCRTYGFAFNKTTIDEITFRVTHGILYGILLLVVLLNFISFFFLPKRSPLVDKLGQKLWSSKMKAWYCLAKLLVCAVIIVATELTVSWNGIKTINELDSAGQTIPFVVGCCVLARVIYVTGVQDRVWKWEEAATWRDMFDALRQRFRPDGGILGRVERVSAH